MSLTTSRRRPRYLFALLLICCVSMYWLWVFGLSQLEQSTKMVGKQQDTREAHVHTDRAFTNSGTIKSYSAEDDQNWMEFVRKYYVSLAGHHQYNLQQVKPEVLLEQAFTDWVKLKPEMDDENWIDFVRKNYVVSPSDKLYNLSSDVPKNPSAGQVQAVLGILPSHGFFLECGAADGELWSNSLYLEKELGWSGLLIEAEPYYFNQLVTRNRKAWLTPVCLSLERYPVMGKFYRDPGFPWRNTLKEKVSTVVSERPCVPLYTLLLAVNRTVIDFFSLDVEGVEQAILETIPFDKVTFKVIALEVGDDVRQKPIKDFLVSKGYNFYKRIRTSYASDFIFTYGSGNLQTPSSQHG